MKTTGARMYLHREGKTVMTSSRIGRVWLMNNSNWLMRALSAQEVVKKALRKGRNDILHARLGHLGGSHSKRIVSM